MGKMELLLLDEDELYGERLAAYVDRSACAARVRVRQFTRQEPVERWLAEATNRSSCLLVVSDEFYHLARKLCADVRAAVISESFAGCGVDGGLLVLYRFQPLHVIVGELLAFWERGPDEAPVPPVHRTQILTLYSAVGGSGKTITALHLAKQLAFRGQRVFYLGFEPSSTVDLLLASEQPSRFVELMQATRSSSGQLAAKLELLKSHAPLLGIDYAAPAPAAAKRGSPEIGAQEVRCLLEALIGLNRYECIIVDAESSLHPRARTALEMSDVVWWMVLDDFSCLHKTGTYRKLLPSLSGVRFVVNPCTGAGFNEFARHGIPVSAGLPYMAQWKHADTPELMLADSVFAERVRELYVAMMHEAIGHETIEEGGGLLATVQLGDQRG